MPAYPVEDKYRVTLHLLGMLLHQPKARQFVEDNYDAEILRQISKDADVADFECEMQWGLGDARSAVGTSAQPSRDLNVTVACFAKRSITGRELMETLTAQSSEALAGYIMQQLGWNPPKQRTRKTAGHADS